MNEMGLYTQMENLMHRAKKRLDFDLEKALCLVMDTYAHQFKEKQSFFRRLFKKTLVGGVSLVKVVESVGGHKYICIKKAEHDKLLCVDQHGKIVWLVKHTNAFVKELHPKEKIVLLSKHAAQALEKDLELLLEKMYSYTQDEVEQELKLHAQVNARGQHMHQNKDFTVAVIAS